MSLIHKGTEKVNPTELRRQRFVDGLVDGKTMKQAAIDAGYSESTALQASREIMPHVRDAFKQAMHHKISIGKLSSTIAAGLDANETKFFQFQGQVVEKQDVIAWSERREYAKLAANLMSLETPKETFNPDGLSIEIKLINENVGGK